MQKIMSDKAEFKQITTKIKSSIHNGNYKKFDNNNVSDKEKVLTMYNSHSIKNTLKDIPPVEVESISTKIENFDQHSENASDIPDERIKINKLENLELDRKEVRSPTTPVSMRVNKSEGNLCEKMPNFLKNYEDILKSINSNKNVGASPKRNMADSHNVFNEFESKNQEASVIKKRNLQFDKLSLLITSTGKKPQFQLQNQKTPSPMPETAVTLQTMTNTEDIKDFYEYTESCMKRIVKLKVTEVKDIEHLMIDLPFVEELKTKRLAVFDLDETLVHCESRSPEKGQVQIKVNLPDGTTGTVGLNIRPGVKDCLTQIQKDYVIIVYTASHQSYADSVIDHIDPNKEFIKYRLYRHNCVKIKYKKDLIYVKDLRILRNVQMKDMVIIDNSVMSFAFQLENGIPILPYTDDINDKELIYLYHYLNSIASCEDLREQNIKNLNMDFLYNSAKSFSKLGSDEDNEKTMSDKEEPNLLSPSSFILKKCNDDKPVYSDKRIKPFSLTSMNENSNQLKFNFDVNDSEMPESSMSELNKRKINKKNSIFQDKLISSLDHLKSNFKSLDK